MRTVQRVIAASALGLPVLLAGQGMALASHHDHHGSPHVKQDQREKNKIDKIAVSGDHANLTAEPENDQVASATNTNDHDEE